VKLLLVNGPETLYRKGRGVRTFTSKDETTIGCFVSGSGPPLVLVHGTAADHGRWAPILPVLERRLTVYAFDRRGRGASGVGEPYAIEREFEDVAAVVDGIGGPVDVLGHSYGALCALEAARLTRHIRRLVLYEPPISTGEPGYPAGMVERLERLLAAGEEDGVVSTVLSELFRVPAASLERLRTLPAWRGRVDAAPSIVRELKAHRRYELRTEAFRDVKVPTRLLLGGASPPFFKAALDKVQVALPQASVAVLPGQTHSAIDMAPELFANEVLSFLARPVV
jgi:pimeloyl-ACP methyl ester carboxylesterase